jgi:hypothetical protein
MPDPMSGDEKRETPPEGKRPPPDPVRRAAPEPLVRPGHGQVSSSDGGTLRPAKGPSPLSALGPDPDRAQGPNPDPAHSPNPDPPDGSAFNPEEEGDRRPTPVRVAMEGSEAEEDQVGIHRRVFEDPETGQEWVVSVGGRSASGILPRRTVPILEIHFAPSEDPDSPSRRALCHGTTLEALQSWEVVGAFGVSEPIPPPSDDPAPRGKPRAKRGKGRRGRRS